jgi:transposase
VVVLSPEERATLQSWAKARSQPQRLVQRAQVVLMAAEGVENQEIAARLRISRPTVQLWRQRFLALRAAGLEKDAPRPGRIPRISSSQVAAIVEATLHRKPPNATHWSTRTMAKAQGVSEATVRRIWQRHNLKPHRLDTFKLSRDPKFIDKLVDIVGLYLNPPDKALHGVFGDVTIVSAAGLATSEDNVAAFVGVGGEIRSAFFGSANSWNFPPFP